MTLLINKRGFMHGSKYNYCPECQEAELELLHDLHLRREMREIKKMVEEENERKKLLKEKGSNVI